MPLTFNRDIFGADLASGIDTPSLKPGSASTSTGGGPSTPIDIDAVATDVAARKEEIRANIQFAAQVGKKTGSYAKLMSLLMQLRKVCDHPFLMPDSGAYGRASNLWRLFI